MLIKKYYLTIISALLLLACARIEAPTGGPKDMAAPLVKEAIPANKATQVTTKTIELTFDEFVVLNSANEQIVISPLPAEAPEYVLKGKSLLIKFKDPLPVNNTYSINFGEGIKDLNENNVFRGNDYSFSTGATLDTCVIRGKVLDALTMKPQSAVSVFVYDPYHDTLPTKGKPAFITKTDLGGNFTIKGLKKKNYTVIAVKDAAKNYQFDALQDQIAFAEASIPSEIYIADNDTTTKERNKINEFLLFKEKDTLQKVTNSKYNKEGCIFITLNIPATTVGYRSIKPLLSDAFIEERNSSNDTLRLWLGSNAPDTLHAAILADGKLLDTIKVSIPKKTEKKEDKTKKTQDNTFMCNVSNNGSLAYYKPVMLSSARPLTSFTHEKIEFSELKDSVAKPIKPSIKVSDNKKQVYFNYAWNAECKYKMYLPKATYTDMTGTSNDSLVALFSIKPADIFATMILSFKKINPQGNYIIQLINDKEEILHEQRISNTQKAKLEHLSPGNVKLRLIHDNNNNGKWDTGIFKKRQQAERVELFADKVLLKENWETEVEW